MAQLNIEESLVKEGIISREQLQTIKLEQQRSSFSIIMSIRHLNFVPEDALIDFLSKKLHLEKFNLEGFSPPKEITSILPTEFLWKKKVLPLFKQNEVLAVGVLDPMDAALLDELRFRTGLFIKPHLVKEKELLDALSQYFDRRKGEKIPFEPALARVKEEGAKPSVVEAVDLLMQQAIRVNASDIHIEPYEGKVGIRLRIDGVLKEMTPPEASLFNAFISRVKIMANLDIAEKRQPQDGRFTFKYEEGAIDIRVSVIPTIEGESIVLRLLRQNKDPLSLSQSGMSERNLEKYLGLIRIPSGIILVTGPTGSGKTTTLYASLLTLESTERNVITIEDPVEYHLDFARQIQVNPKVNLTFATGLRSVLRHDPDVIMVGEIRDLDTATIAIQAALTGHLVFSTLHTNDAASAVTRLTDMGIEPFLIASCVNGVVAQRLVRMLCPKCKKPDSDVVLPKEITRPPKAIIYKAAGCPNCSNTGFAGRIGIFEIMELSQQIGRLAVEKSSSEMINAQCRKEGMKFLADDGWEKVFAGLTTPQELMRVIGIT